MNAGHTHGARPFFRHLGITTRPPRTFRVLLPMDDSQSNASLPWEEVMDHHSPHFPDPSLAGLPTNHNGTLAAIVQ